MSTTENWEKESDNIAILLPNSRFCIIAEPKQAGLWKLKLRDRKTFATRIIAESLEHETLKRLIPLIIDNNDKLPKQITQLVKKFKKLLNGKTYAKIQIYRN